MPKRLVKSNDKIMGGVCAGIATYFGWDATLVRVLYVIISIISAAFPGILIYFILWIIMPSNP